MSANGANLNFPIPVYEIGTLGQVIKMVRKKRGMTQPMLAAETNTSVKFISNVERGKNTAEIGKVFMLLAILGIGIQLVDLKG